MHLITDKGKLKNVKAIILLTRLQKNSQVFLLQHKFSVTNDVTNDESLDLLMMIHWIYRIESEECHYHIKRAKYLFIRKI